MRTIQDIDVKSKTVLLRTEFNVVLDEGVTSDPRLRYSVPTINALCERGARVLICSHLGRPWGSRDPSLSLHRLVEPLKDLLGRSILFVGDCIGPERLRLQRALQDGEILLLENVRFYAEENANDPVFAKLLSQGVDVYVNDAFGNCHRPHASMIGVPRFVREKAAGILLDRELKLITLFLNKTEHPAVAIIGGAKVAGKDGKIHVIRNLLSIVDVVCLVGKLAFFFLQSKNIQVGSTITADTRQIDAPGSDLWQTLADCRSLLEMAQRLGKHVILPVDCKTNELRNIDIERDSFPDKAIALDIGPRTISAIREVVETARSVVWNGPAGFVEQEEYRTGTVSIAQAVAESTARCLIGGGDTVAALAGFKVSSERIHICTGGGAMLTLLMGRELPAVRALVQ